MKQTAVEWLVEQCGLKPDGKLVIQAKAMEKEQIEESYSEGYSNGRSNWGYGSNKKGEQYYNETYKSE